MRKTVPQWIKPHGHWELADDEGEGPVLLADVPLRPPADDGDAWGHWVLNTKRPRSLDITVARGYVYSVPIDECRDMAGEAGWLRHLNNKNWASPEDLGWFVRALADILGHWSW